MDIIDFYRLEQKRVHDWTRRGISDLTPEEWHYTIEGNGNNIAFLVWHCVRAYGGQYPALYFAEASNDLDGWKLA